MLRRIVLYDPHRQYWLSFSRPIQVFCARRAEEIVPLLQEIEQRVESDRLHAAGFITYEAAAGFDPGLRTHPAGELPLLLFGLFREPEISREYPLETAAAAPDQAAPLTESPAWSRTEDDEQYARIFHQAREEIAAGNIYQINHTVRLQGSVDPGVLQQRLAQRAPYGAWVDGETFSIVSGSPELMFRLDGTTLVSKPMKGTAHRGLDSRGDERQRSWLANSAKNRAENLMITDMVRNDLGRVAVPGSVQVERLFDIEQYPTVWQKTSTISATTQACVSEIFRALFPAASITGAPKHASMKLIRQFESGPREIYTGTIGYLSPGRQAQFNVAIRTAWTDKRTGCSTYGVGGGIVWDSMLEEELEELTIKSLILSHGAPRTDFSLLETMLWQPGAGIASIDLHLDRLLASAAYFGIPVTADSVRETLAQVCVSLPGQAHRLRLLVDHQGLASVSAAPEQKVQEAVQEVELSPVTVNSQDLFLYHKTTHREIYQQAAAAVSPGREALLVNQDGFLTETNISSLLFRKGEAWFTPPVSCGLLPGTSREKLLREGSLEEKPLHQSELVQVDELAVINAVRGRRRAILVSPAN